MGNKIIRIISQKSGIDGAIFLTILSRIIQAGGGVGSIFFIALYLSAEEQGYYYTFASILAIQIFFELGLSNIITQYTAHEFAFLKWENDDAMGDQFYKSRLSSLLRFCVKWFGLISILLFFILIYAGFYFFTKFNKNPTIEWKIPWIILCFSTALNLFIDPILAFFDGLGEIKDMARVRLFQKSASVILLFVFFILGFKLYSSALASIIAILINYGQIFFSKRFKKLSKIWYYQTEWKIKYMRDIFPLQWKIALSWVSGYFIFQLFNPVLFATEGPVVAGQMGMTLQALNGISSISMSWISTKIPLFSSYVAKGDFNILDDVFSKTVKQLTRINFILILGFLSFSCIIFYLNFQVSNRFLPIFPLILLCTVTFCNQFVFSWSIYLRCHKQEPFLIMSIVTAFLCALSTFVLGNNWGLLGLVVGYSFISLFLGLPWAFYIFQQKRNLWHH